MSLHVRHVYGLLNYTVLFLLLYPAYFSQGSIVYFKQDKAIKIIYGKRL